MNNENTQQADTTNIPNNTPDTAIHVAQESISENGSVSTNILRSDIVDTLYTDETNDIAYLMTPVQWRADKNGKKAHADIMLPVPVITDTDIMARLDTLLPVIKTMLSKELIEKGIKPLVVKGQKTFSAEQVSIDKAIELLSAKNSVRLTKDMIQAFITENLSAELIVAIANAKGIDLKDTEGDELPAPVLAIYSSFKNDLLKLASNSYTLSIERAKALLKAINYTNEQGKAGVVFNKLQDKLNTMATPVSKDTDYLNIDL